MWLLGGDARHEKHGGLGVYGFRDEGLGLRVESKAFSGSCWYSDRRGKAQVIQPGDVSWSLIPTIMDNTNLSHSITVPLKSIDCGLGIF